MRVDDLRSDDPVDRLLEESWEARSTRASRRREVLVEVLAGASFLAIALPLWLFEGSGKSDVTLTLLLVFMYSLVAGAVRFPLGAGNVVPTYMVLVPMLILLPPAEVPLLAAAGLLLASVARWCTGQASAKHVLFAVPNAWHALGPAVALLIAGRDHAGLHQAIIYAVAFVSGCVLDLASSTVREAGALSVAPKLQMRVVADAWLIDACIAPVGLLIARAATSDHATVLLAMPLCVLLIVLERERRRRIGQAHQRLELVARERSRLQTAVGRLGEAFAAKLDLDALASIVLRSLVEAVDADAGIFTIQCDGRPELRVVEGKPGHDARLEDGADLAALRGEAVQVTSGGISLLAIPLVAEQSASGVGGMLVVARTGDPFREDEQALMQGLVDRARVAFEEILGHEELRGQALTDALTGLGNRRQLAHDLDGVLREAGAAGPHARAAVLMLFDLDGFKSYNDTFGHPAGDALLARLGQKLTHAVAPDGSAYRLGGDEFCALVRPSHAALPSVLEAAADALTETGENFTIRASCGAVLLPHEAETADWALQLADQRMYSQKQRKPSGARAQTRDVLVSILRARGDALPEHSSGVAALAVGVGRRLGMNAEQLDELMRAAELHDIGKVGVPDAILDKPGPLDEEEWVFMRQHTVLGERILSAAPALRPVARIVRASHERWDGHGYPDRLANHEIPLAARIIAACDAYDAIISDRCYRAGRSAAVAIAELRREAGRQFDPNVVEAVIEELAHTSVGDAAELAEHADLHVEDLTNHLLGLLSAPVAAHPSSAADAA